MWPGRELEWFCWQQPAPAADELPRLYPCPHRLPFNRLAELAPGGYLLPERYLVPGFGPRDCLPFR